MREPTNRRQRAQSLARERSDQGPLRLKLLRRATPEGVEQAPLPGMDLQELLSEGSAVSLSTFGYRPDVPFSALPKLEVRIEPHTYVSATRTAPLPRGSRRRVPL